MRRILSVGGPSRQGHTVIFGSDGPFCTKRGGVFAAPDKLLEIRRPGTGAADRVGRDVARADLPEGRVPGPERARREMH